MARRRRKKKRATACSMLKDHFRPEFLNRVDDVIVFHSLKEEQIEKIVELQLAIVSARLKEQRGITISISDSAKSCWPTKASDPPTARVH